MDDMEDRLRSMSRQSFTTTNDAAEHSDDDSSSFYQAPSYHSTRSTITSSHHTNHFHHHQPRRHHHRRISNTSQTGSSLERGSSAMIKHQMRVHNNNNNSNSNNNINSGKRSFISPTSSSLAASPHQQQQQSSKHVATTSTTTATAITSSDQSDEEQYYHTYTINNNGNKNRKRLIKKYGRDNHSSERSPLLKPSYSTPVLPSTSTSKHASPPNYYHQHQHQHPSRYQQQQNTFHSEYPQHHHNHHHEDDDDDDDYGSTMMENPSYHHHHNHHHGNTMTSGGGGGGGASMTNLATLNDVEDQRHVLKYRFMLLKEMKRTQRWKWSFCITSVTSILLLLILIFFSVYYMFFKSTFIFIDQIQVYHLPVDGWLGLQTSFNCFNPNFAHVKVKSVELELTLYDPTLSLSYIIEQPIEFHWNASQGTIARWSNRLLHVQSYINIQTSPFFCQIQDLIMRKPQQGYSLKGKITTMLGSLYHTQQLQKFQQYYFDSEHNKMPPLVQCFRTSHTVPRLTTMEESQESQESLKQLGTNSLLRNSTQVTLLSSSTDSCPLRLSSSQNIDEHGTASDSDGRENGHLRRLVDGSTYSQQSDAVCMDAFGTRVYPTAYRDTRDKI